MDPSRDPEKSGTEEGAFCSGLRSEAKDLPIKKPSEESVSSLWPLLTAEQITLAYEGSSQDLQKFDQFLAYCSERFGKTKSPFPIDYQYVKSQVSWIDQSSLRPRPLQKEIDAFSSSQMWERPIIVICGDLPAESMKASAENWFSPLSLLLLSFKNFDPSPLLIAYDAPSHLGITYQIPPGSKVKRLLREVGKG